MTAPRVRRSDALPENSLYFDNGCDVAPQCLSCPLPECKYVVEEGKRGGPSTYQNAARNRQWLQEYEGGTPVHYIAAEAGVTVRTVHRGIASVRG